MVHVLRALIRVGLDFTCHTRTLGNGIGKRFCLFHNGLNAGRQFLYRRRLVRCAFRKVLRTAAHVRRALVDLSGSILDVAHRAV